MKSQTAALEAIRKMLVMRGQTLGVAESVTAGNLQAALSLAENATEFFQGGLTLYNTGQKARHLHIDPIAAERTNCVSDKISQSMAEGACRFFSAEWGIGITGYAAPVPEWNVKNTLFAWYSFAFKERPVFTRKIEINKTTMSKVQHYYVKVLLASFAEYLSTINE